MLVFYLFLILWVALCNAGCGNFIGASGKVYYLDPLTRTPDYTGAEAPYYNYIYNYCQNVNADSGCTTPAPAIQITSTGQCTPIGLLPPAISEVSEGNLKIVYTNNQDLCGNPRTIPRITTLLLSCQPDMVYNLVKIEEPGTCQYEFIVQTKYACPGSKPGNATDCCEAQPNPGCIDPNIEACVCKANPECCSSSWDSKCVDLVDSLGCGDCKLGDCCSAHGGRGCDDRKTSTCVCDVMEECCTRGWSRECAIAVNKYNCGQQCPGICCEADKPCNDAGVRDCVCKRDVYCCRVQWDATCIEEAKQHNCTYCASTASSFSTLTHRPVIKA